jgi:hypothetical protein
MARTYRVSVDTIRKALWLLADKDLIEYGRYGRPRVKGSTPSAPPPPRPSSQHVLYERIVGDIASGTLRDGQSLPKIAAAAAHNSVSRDTVSKVYRQLCSEGLVSRVGKGFRIGPGPVIGAAPVVRRPVILVVCWGPASWEGTASSPRTGDFARMFVSEAERNSVEVRPCSLHEYGPESDSTTGLSRRPLGEISATVASLEEGYLGALVVGRGGMERLLPDICRILLSHRRPVVYLDSSADENGYMADSPLFARAHVSELALAEECVNYCRHYGHRAAFYPTFADAPPWQRQRLALLREAGSGDRPFSLVHTVAPDRQAWLSGQVVERLDWLRRKGPRRVRAALETTAAQSEALVASYGEAPSDLGCWAGLASFAQWYLSHNSSTRGRAPVAPDIYVSIAAVNLFALFEHRHVDLIICPNDSMARHWVAPWMRALNLSRMSDLSVISFDNDLRFSTFALTSIDFGYAGLGYSAFQEIRRVLPVRRSRPGALVAKPKVVDRGTVRAHAERSRRR